jgi:hypothetical protein
VTRVSSLGGGKERGFHLGAGDRNEGLFWGRETGNRIPSGETGTRVSS